MPKSLHISKLDAARRQLETAIRLYFNDCDPVSIHTLTAASYNIVRDINRSARGTKLIIKEQLIERVVPEHQKEVRNKLNEAENFFKHADNDPTGVLQFSPSLTELMIWEACMAYFQLSGEQLILAKVFNAWFSVRNPHLFRLTEEQQRQISRSKKEIETIDKQEYFRLYLPAFESIDS